MRTPLLLAALIASPTLASPSDSMFDWVTITDPGNLAFDRPSTFPVAPGRGSVGYNYRIARQEVSSQQYLTFLNTFTTQSDGLASRITRPGIWGGRVDPTYSGPGVRYVLRDDVANAGDLPVLGVTWREAAYFINWMNNDLSSDASAIENGAYDTSTFGGDPQSGFTDQSARNNDARYFLPTYDEWIKAAHYDPDIHGPGQGGWWMFNNGTDEAPIPGAPGVGETNAGWFVDGNPTPARETPLGSYPDSMSPWGLIDVSGGGGEWTESWSPFDTTTFYDRLWHGGAAGSSGHGDSLDFPGSGLPISQSLSTSFRVAAIVPTPATLLTLTPLLFTKRRRIRPARDACRHA